MADPLDVEHTLVAALARLGLGQVPGLHGDGLHLPCRDQDLVGAHQLGAVLQGPPGGGGGGEGGREKT